MGKALPGKYVQFNSHLFQQILYSILELYLIITEKSKTS